MRRGRRAAQQDDEQYHEIHAEEHDQRDGPRRKARAPLERARIHQAGNGLAERDGRAVGDAGSQYGFERSRAD